jgi:hypothetical protein
LHWDTIAWIAASSAADRFSVVKSSSPSTPSERRTSWQLRRDASRSWLRVAITHTTRNSGRSVRTSRTKSSMRDSANCNPTMATP